jgi:1-acyl-sn-glycerol-3-phosphate acyltransferase
MTRFAGVISGWARDGYACLAMLLGLGAVVVLGLLALPIALVLMFLPAAIRILAGRRFISYGLTGYLCFLKIFCRVRVDSSALDTVRPESPLIIIANHPSLLDAVVLLAGLPRAVCVMKGNLKRNILFGPMAHLAGYVSNDDPMTLIRRTCDELAGGAQILIFPEGTRTLEFPVNPFSEATAFIAARSGVPVQALFMEFSSPYLGKAWPLFRKPVLPLCITVEIGQKFAALSDRLAMTKMLEFHYRSHLTRKPVDLSANKSESTDVAPYC